MRRAIASLCLLLACTAHLPAMADAEALREFDTPQQRERYHELLEEVRCLVCQNESLASSSADLAQDLRDEVYRLVVEENRSNAAAIDFLTQRYGDFVLYRPPVRPYTWLLWFGPILMLLAGLTVLVVVVRHRRQAVAQPLTPAERERAERLLEGDDESS
ncbi:MAG: cytochrome c-type biogenesis protein CcmH [Deinococcus-Thermus bacterium]|jgi:cytochrome c-type biogenesis protein CcmH|nr:cytochrome c-type biogenesis protein CcmH [Deinococcota bacterium]